MSRRQILPTLYFSILLIIGFSTPAWFWYTTLQIRPGLGPDPASIASRICWFIQTKVSVWLFISSWDPLIALVVALLTSMPKKFVQAFKLACWFSYFTVTYKFVEELIVKPYTERAGMKTFDVIVAATQFAMDFVLFNEVVLFVVSERYRMVILFVNGAMRDTTVEELEHAATILEKAGSDGLAAKFGAFFGQVFRKAASLQAHKTGQKTSLKVGAAQKGSGRLSRSSSLETIYEDEKTLIQAGESPC